jgi:hypothetical protein
MLMMTLTGLSHAAPTGRLLPLLADWTHAVAAAVRMGGLLGFGVALCSEAFRSLAPDSRTKLRERSVRRFSTVATCAVVVARLHRPLRGPPPHSERASMARHALRSRPHSEARTAELAAHYRRVELFAARPRAVRSPSRSRAAPGARVVRNHGLSDQPTARKQR